MSEDRNDPAPTTPPPLVPPPVRAPETRSSDTTATSPVDGQRDSAAPGDGPEHTPSHSAAQTPGMPSDAPRVAPDASRPAGSVPAATDDRDAATPAAQPTAAHPTAVLAREEPPRWQPAAPTAPTAPAAQEPERIFVPPAPVAPKRKGNRAIGSLIAVVSVVIFGVVYALVSSVIIAIAAPQQSVLRTLPRFLADPVFYVPGILFVVGFVLVVLLVNRAAWWAFVLGSLIVGAIVYFGTIGVQLITENVVAMTPTVAAAAFAAYAVNPFVIAAALVARETSMWIGAAISSRGRRMKARNLVAREEFDMATAAHRAEYDRSHAA